MLWALDENRHDGARASSTRTSSSAEPKVWDEPGTYVTTDVELANTLSHEWNHGLGEIVTALLDHGMQLTTFVEHTSVPWPALPARWSCSTAASTGCSTDRSGSRTRIRCRRSRR